MFDVIFPVQDDDIIYTNKFVVEHDKGDKSVTHTVQMPRIKEFFRFTKSVHNSHGNITISFEYLQV